MGREKSNEREALSSKKHLNFELAAKIKYPLLI